MKKTILLGTTALFAAAVVTGGMAQAAEDPISVGISGYFKSAMGFISQDNADGELANTELSNALANSSEISIGGSTLLDNGISVGFNVQLDPAGWDERHVFFSGGFGQIQTGQIEGVRQQMTNFAPGAASIGVGVNTAHFVFGNGGSIGSSSTYTNGIGDEDAIKVNYFSPTFNGFRVGVSYAPDHVAGGSRGGAATGGLGTLHTNIGAGLEYSNSFDGFSIRVSAGTESSVLETCNVNAAGLVSGVAADPGGVRTTADQNCENNPTSVAFGSTVSFGQFAIGGGYLETEQVGNTATGSGRERSDMELGVSYSSGPMKFALQYAEAELDDIAGLTDQFEVYQLQAEYVLGPGIVLGAALTKGEFDDATANGLDNDYTNVVIGAHLGF
jgi:outer membrane protein OmpU